MLSLVRGGTRGLYLKIRAAELPDIIVERFGLERKSYRDALDDAREDQTLVFTSFSGPGKTISVYLARVSADELMTFILNEHLCDHVESARILPRTIFFRVSGDYKLVLEQIRKDYKAFPGKLSHLPRWWKNKKVAVCFTEKRLNRSLRLEDFHPDILYVDMPFETLYMRLRSRALGYFNEARAGRDWKNLEIRIYDSWERYDMQSRRLRAVLEELETGLLLGEGWGKDYARVLMPVPVYRFQLATFLEPVEIKDVLMGLEYNASGERIVDLDLYDGKKKIGWQDRAEIDEDRNATGARLRLRLWARLSPKVGDELERIEKKMADVIPRPM